MTPNIVSTLIEGVGAVFEDPGILLQVVQQNPVVAVAVTVVAAVGIGMTILPCGRTSAKKIEQPVEKPKPKPKLEGVEDRPKVVKKAPALAIADLWGVYQPVNQLLRKDAATTAKHSTYAAGYKSSDDKGRVFNFHRAPIEPATMDWTIQPTWENLKQANTQEVIAIVIVEEGDLRPTEVVWKWAAEGPLRGSRDKDDASQTGLRFASVDGQALSSDSSNDRAGTCTAPVWQKTLTIKDGPKVVYISAVKLVCTNVGGDGFKLNASFSRSEFERCGGSGEGPSDTTGVIRIWKRIDVEFLRMTDTVLEVDGVPKYYEPAFVQMDITLAREIQRDDILATDYDTAPPVMAQLARTNARRNKDVGWFLLMSCCSAYTPPVVVGDEANRYNATHCSITVYKGDAAFTHVKDQEFYIGTTITTATYKRHDRLMGVIVDTAPPVNLPPKIRLFQNLANQPEDENYVDFRVVSSHAYGQKSVFIVEPEDYCTDFQANTLANERKLLLQYPKETVGVRYSEKVEWLGRGGFSFPNNFSVRFIYTGTRNLRGQSASVKVNDDVFVTGQLFIFTTHNNNKKSQEAAIVHEFCHAIGLYLPHKCGFEASTNLGKYPVVEGFKRFSCCMNYRTTLLYREEHQNPGKQLSAESKLDRAIEAWDKGTDVPDFCHRHLDAIKLSIFEKNSAIWNW